MAQKPLPPPQWPPSSELTTQIVPRAAATLITSASIHINAPASLVFSTLLNTADYSWNQWVPRVSIQSQAENISSEEKDLCVGTEFTLHVIMNEKKPNSETPTQLKVTDISIPERQSGYIPVDVLESEDSYTADLSRVYRISWMVHGGFASRGLKAERFHEIIVLNDGECEVRTWENQGGILANAVKWMYKTTLQEKFLLWCGDLKRVCEQKISKNQEVSRSAAG